MKYSECNLKDNVKCSVIKCLSEAIGDDIKACLRRENINDKNSNGKKFLKWDLINRNFILNFSGMEMTAEYAKRGAWYFVPLFNKETGTLFSVMREERFNALQKKQEKRRKAHYVDALVRSFNIDLDQNKQMNLFKEEQFPEDEVKTIVEGVLRGFQLNNAVVRRYATILFEEYNSELISVRCCVLDSSLQIVDEENWSEFIHYNESVIVDTVENISEEKEMPKIKLKDKAKKRIGQKDLVAMKDDVMANKRQEL